MALPARRLTRASVALTDAAIKRLVAFPLIRKAISGGLERVAPTDVHIPTGGRFVSFRLEDPSHFHPALYATIRIGQRGTLLTIGTRKADVKDKPTLARHLARAGWDERSKRWKRTLTESQRRSLVYQLRAGGIIGGTRTQRVLVPRERVEAVARRYAARPEFRRMAAMNPVMEYPKFPAGVAALKNTTGYEWMKKYHVHLRNPVKPRKPRQLTREDRAQLAELEAKRATLISLLGRPMTARTFESVMRDLERVNRHINRVKFEFEFENSRRRSRSNPILATLGFNPGHRRTRRNPMKWLTKADLANLPPLYSQENVQDPIAWVKFFTPWGSASWFITEYDPAEGLFFGLYKDMNGEELGYVSEKELRAIRGQFGLGVERDLGFRPTPLSKIRSGAVSNRRRRCPPGMVRSRKGKCVPPLPRVAMNPVRYVVRDTFRGEEIAAAPTMAEARRYMAKIARHYPAGALTVVQEHARFNRRPNPLTQAEHDEIMGRERMLYERGDYGRAAEARHLAAKYLSRGADRNPPEAQTISVPFRDGQKVTPDQMRRWLSSIPRGPIASMLQRRFEQSMNQYHRFHLGKEPQFFRYQAIPMGAQKRVTDVDFVVSEGKEWGALYQVPKHSGKYDPSVQGRYIHAHGESGIDIREIKRPTNPSRLPERFHTADGKFAGVLVGKSKVKIGSWYEH